jgi:very-short-patch-repair endonuclease
MLTCCYCNKECKNTNSHRNHERLCPNNSNRNYKNGMKDKIPWNKGLTKEDPRVAKNANAISEATKGKIGKPWTAEQKKAKSEWRKQYHIDHPEAHPNRKLAGNRSKMSYPEQVAYDWLTENKVNFEHNKKIGKFFPDFVVNDNVIIEIDGEHWHNEEKDSKKDSFFEEAGYTVIRIKAKEMIQKRLSQIIGV